MTDDDRFRQIKLLLGRLDDLNQERRRLFTDWATQRLASGPFVTAMKANAAATRAEADRLDGLLS